MDKLIPYEIYETIIFQGKRKALYLGKHPSRRKASKPHIIVTRRYHSKFPIMYRFGRFKLEGNFLHIEDHKIQKVTELEEEYLVSLLDKKDL